MAQADVAYLYGYEPVLVVGQDPDGRYEVVRLKGLIERHPDTDLNFGDRAEDPVAIAALGPPSTGDRLTDLEQQMGALVSALNRLAGNAPAAETPATEPTEAPATGGQETPASAEEPSA